MKKVFILLLSLSITFTLLACAKHTISTNNNAAKTNIDAEGNRKVIIRKNPKQGKVITDKKDITKVIEFINSIELQDKVPLKPGWAYSVDIVGNKNYSILFMGNNIFVDNDGYKINEQVLKDLQNLYEGLSYKEVEVDMTSELK